jgi:hypothetical protein
MMAISAATRRSVENTKGALARARAFAKEGRKDAAVVQYMMAYAQGYQAFFKMAKKDRDTTTAMALDQLMAEAVKEVHKLCGIRSNPSKSAEYGALGAGAGALLLGPVGAIAGGYVGAKEGGKKKRKPKKNPDRSRILRNAMKGT